MNIEFNLGGRTRKELVKAISEILSVKAVYKFMPTAAFEIGEFTVTREGALEFSGSTDSDIVKSLIDRLSEKGFVTVNNGFYSKSENLSEESKIKPHSTTQDETEAIEESETNIDNNMDFNNENEEFYLTVSMPRDFFDDTVFVKLDRLIDSKNDLFRMAFKTDDLSYKMIDDRVEFPWFSEESNETESDAYCEFISALCNMAKEQKRINKSQAQTDNPKFAMRVFLIRLGMVGEEFKTARKVLLRNLSGSAAYRRKGGTVCSDED